MTDLAGLATCSILAWCETQQATCGRSAWRLWRSAGSAPGYRARWRSGAPEVVLLATDAEKHLIPLRPTFDRNGKSRHSAHNYKRGGSQLRRRPFLGTVAALAALPRFAI